MLNKKLVHPQNTYLLEVNNFVDVILNFGYVEVQILRKRIFCLLLNRLFFFIKTNKLNYYKFYITYSIVNILNYN